jgi:primosomal protein N' (replication factor Y)
VLQGVTGSGKTEVYLRLIAEARQRGRGALVLVPEIALTPQLAARFRARFGDDVAVLHSGLPAAQRRAAWRRLRAGEVGIALGARSAVFAPVRQLGVVVVDEEHDPSFKQEDGLRYSGRDLALVRAQKNEAVAVLGSATPSLETFRNVEQGRYQRLLLPTRANPAAAARPLPPVEIIDLRRQPPMADGLFSKPLLQAMQATFQAGEQSILFLNRRGFSPLVLCRACGHVLRCTQCAVAMTYHQARALLACHYCGREEAVPRLCPSCHAPKLERLGTGTERVETLVREHFPTARVARLDRDSAGGRGGAVLERVLGQVHARAIDILVGTQMVTKGHDFEGVTLVGVLLPDQGMHMPDFRAAERTFQLLEQVAGRAGRGERPGRVLVQTYTPEHPAVAALPAHDYEGFARAELGRRREASYPPFTRLIALRLEGGEGTDVRQAAGQAAARARAAGGEAVRVKGPAEAPIAVIRGLHRWQVWLAGTDRTALAAAARAAAGTSSPGVRLVVDVDPQSVL